MITGGVGERKEEEKVVKGKWVSGGRGKGPSHQKSIRQGHWEGEREKGNTCVDVASMSANDAVLGALQRLQPT